MTFVGFGFGPIQTGLMLCEAVEAGGFDRLVVSEVDQGLVDAVRGAGNRAMINIAARTGVRSKALERVELYNPRVPGDRDRIIEAVAEADELATAVPSVNIYAAGGDSSIAALIAAGARPDHQQVIYTAENNNYAAEALQEAIAHHASAERLAGIQILNTVIGKMSGVISSQHEMRRLGLVPLVPGSEKCALVEEFNRILITRITLPGFQRRIRVFEEKDDLLPFEEAKLYGHNAVHALLGYLARLRGYEIMSRIADDTPLLDLGRHAFVDESGAALIKRHAHRGDPLFTPAGYAAYADDLLQRMTNPFLMDRVDRIIRDPRRKLAWNDRLFGTMRVALDQGIQPRIMAMGAAAAVEHARESERIVASPRNFLCALWGDEASGGRREECLRLVEAALPELSEWRA